ncbi:MAG: PDZ domain-containing protein [Planctomycetota bacterium]
MNGRPPRTTRLTILILALALAGTATGRLRSAEPTRAEEAAFQRAVERVAGAVVRIEPLALSTGSTAAEAAAGSGPSTGLVVARGRVLTTAFAVPADIDSAVVVLPEGGRRAATVRARDASRGLVLLAVDDLPEPPPLEAVRRAELRPGQWAIAVGRGWDAATASPAVGIISAVDRVWGKAVQTDAAVSPMNYGGPLVDIAGRVIGVLAPLPAETAGMTEGTELYDAGIAFAVPLEDVLAMLPRLEQGESLAAGILGIGYRSRDMINGEPVIASVRQGSPAAKAGLRPGDRIVRIAGRDVTRVADARHALAPRYAGDTITVSVERGDGDDRETLDVTATLVETLPPWRRAVIGVVPRPAADDAAAGQGGPVIAWVLPGGPADRAGLRAGDQLTALAPADAAAASLDSPAAATGALAGVEPGQPVTVSFTRGGQLQTVEVATAPLAGDVPAEGPPREPAAADPLDGPKDPVDVVRLEAAEVADPPLAVIPRGAGPVGVLVWCGPPHGKAAEGEATPWKAAAARHDVAVILPGSAAADAWSRDDIGAVTRALASLHARRPLDPARIGIAGSGAGAAFAWLVAERLGGGVGGVALAGTGLPRRAAIEPATPANARWVLLGPGSDDASRQRIAADAAQLERAGHAVGLVPADEGDPPADLLCRWVTLLGLL